MHKIESADFRIYDFKVRPNDCTDFHDSLYWGGLPKSVSISRLCPISNNNVHLPRATRTWLEVLANV